MYICGECIIVVYGIYELSFSSYDQEIEKDRSIEEVK